MSAPTSLRERGCAQRLKLVRPFDELSTHLLWPRLASAAPSPLLSKRLARRTFVQRPSCRSLRVRRVTFLPHIRRIYDSSLRMTLGFESFGPLAQQATASYAIRVPRTGSLPSASFRFWVAPDTLAVRLGVPVIKASIGTRTRQVTSWFAFACQLKTPVKTLRVMPDAPKEATLLKWKSGLRNSFKG